MSRPRKIRRGAPGRAAAALAGVLAVTAAIAGGCRSSIDSSATAEIFEGLSLLDHRGEPFGSEQLHGRWTYVFFGFTHCPGVCPATLSVLARTRDRLADAAPGVPVQIALVTVDPARDSPNALAAYLRPFGEGFVGVTGEAENLRACRERLGVSSRAGQGTLIDHSAAIYVFDPGGRLVEGVESQRDVESLARAVLARAQR